MTRGRIVLAALVALVLLGAGRAAVAAEESEVEAAGIVFLHLKFDRQNVALVDFKVTPGRLKPGVKHAGERILLQVRSSTGNLLWEGTTPDPRSELVEAGHHAHTKPVGKLVERATPEITARVPFFEETQTIEVFRVSPGQGAPAQQKRLGSFRLKS